MGTIVEVILWLLMLGLLHALISDNPKIDWDDMDYNSQSCKLPTNDEKEI